MVRMIKGWLCLIAAWQSSAMPYHRLTQYFHRAARAFHIPTRLVQSYYGFSKPSWVLLGDDSDVTWSFQRLTSGQPGLVSDWRGASRGFSWSCWVFLGFGGVFRWYGKSRAGAHHGRICYTIWWFSRKTCQMCSSNSFRRHFSMTDLAPTASSTANRLALPIPGSR
jgi:hypothetical protein